MTRLSSVSSLVLHYEGTDDEGRRRLRVKDCPVSDQGTPFPLGTEFLDDMTKGIDGGVKCKDVCPVFPESKRCRNSCVMKDKKMSLVGFFTLRRRVKI